MILQCFTTGWPSCCGSGEQCPENYSENECDVSQDVEGNIRSTNMQENQYRGYVVLLIYDDTRYSGERMLICCVHSQVHIIIMYFSCMHLWINKYILKR